MKWPEVRYACSLVVARQTWRLLAYHLPFVAEAAGVPMTGAHHDAQADADVAGRGRTAAAELRRSAHPSRPRIRTRIPRAPCTGATSASRAR